MAARLHTITNPQLGLQSGREASLLRRNLTTSRSTKRAPRGHASELSSRTAPAGSARREVKREHKRERKREPIFSEPMAALLAKLTTTPEPSKEKTSEPDSPFAVVSTAAEEKKEDWLVGGLSAKHVLAAAKSINAGSFDASAISSVPLNTLSMLKGILFKRDQPYRTMLPLQGALTTSSTGGVNLTQSCSSIASVSEWTAIDALFDEFFIHSMRFRYFPINDLGGGVGQGGSAALTCNLTAVASNTTINGPICMVSLFSGSPLYNACSAMNANSTLAVHHTGKPFTYYWRNNTKFEPRGISGLFASGTNVGWQGWSQIASSPFIGGQIQFRLLNDAIIGTGAGAVIMGSYLMQYDVSFRSRS